MPFRELWTFVFMLALSGTLWTGATAQQVPLSDLEKLQNQYESRLEHTRKPLIELGNKYREALTNLQNELQKKGDLESLLTVQKEIKRFDREKSPAAEVPSLESLSRLHKIYRNGYDNKLVELGNKLKVAEVSYRNKLNSVMRHLTAAGKLEEALKVRSVIEQLGNEVEGGETTLETDLVLHYRFDEDSGEIVRDSSGIGKNGRLMGDAKTLSTSGARGRYAVFDGEGDFIECPHYDSLVLTSHGTISVWVRPKRLENLRGLVSKYTPNHSWVLRTWKDAERAKVSFGDFDHGNRSRGELREGRWGHVVVTLDGGKVAFYFNGELDSEGQRSAPLKANTDPLRIGSDYDGRYFNGAIDDVRIYRRALSAEEIAELFKVES